ncbi:MAG: YggT family protein [Alphaproteobacteria bacterium CG11_big_fil_rev_8_21_14_0_20_39_49]|nr:MAG: YggT family protein [Alphaproteobacteria bacterium CG11_big_fil_rev_8_21_14_0_20_39_49]
MNINPFIDLIATVFRIYGWIMFAWIIVSLLLTFNVINRHNQFVARLYEALFKMTEPVLRRIRRWMPDLGVIDISPIVVFLGIEFLINVLYTYFYTPF